jgi:WD repeat-containing protein 68
MSANDEVNRKEIYTYEAPWMTYSMAWCRRGESGFRMAVGSYKEEYSNQIHIIQLQHQVGGNPLRLYCILTQ